MIDLDKADEIISAADVYITEDLPRPVRAAFDLLVCLFAEHRQLKADLDSLRESMTYCVRGPG